MAPQDRHCHSLHELRLDGHHQKHLVQDLWLGFKGSGFGVWGLGFEVGGLGFGFQFSGFGFRVSGFGFRVSGLGFRVPGSGFRVSDFGFGVSGFGVGRRTPPGARASPQRRAQCGVPLRISVHFPCRLPACRQG